MPLFGGLEKCCFWGKSRFWATLTLWMINHLHPLSNKRYRKKKYAFSTLIGTFVLGVKKKAAASKQPPQSRGIYKIIFCLDVHKPLILLGFSKSSVSPFIPQNRLISFEVRRFSLFIAQKSRD